MSIFLLYNWHFINYEIWPRLEKSENAIDELYCVLLDTYLENQKEAFFDENGTKEEIEKKKEYYWELVGAVNDVQRAMDEFYKIPVPATELGAINIVEGYYKSLLEYKYKLAKEYKKYLKEFLLKYNIRYHICDPCKLTLTLEGLLSSQLDYIKHSVKISGDHSKAESIKMLECNLRDIGLPYNEKYCIINSITLIEHFLHDITTQRTLGEALDQSGNLFPSESVKESLRNYYDFANDYPNIRHVGTNSTKKRDLNKSDGILAVSLAVIYSAFITQNYDYILSGKYVKLPEGGEYDLFSILF